MATITQCPLCRIRDGLRSGLRRLKSLKPRPLHCRVAAALPLPHGKQVSGKFLANLFQNARLCDVAYVGTSGIQRTDEPAFEFRLGLHTGEERETGEEERA